jgi:pilus assembly protein CpaC
MHRLLTVAKADAQISPLPGRPTRRVLGMKLFLWPTRLALLSVFLLALVWTPSRVKAQPAEGGSILIQVGAVESRQMSTKKRIRRVFADRAEVVAVSTRENDPTTAVIVGRSVGASTVTLTDEDGKQDKFDVTVVAFDIVQLRSLLARAVPSAGIQVLPAGPTSLVLTGIVDKPEQLQLAVDTVRGVTGLQVINGIRVGGVQQVQLDVVVAQVSRSQLRAMSFNFFADSKNFFLGSTLGQGVVNPAIVGQSSAFLNVSGVLTGAPGTPNGIPTNFLAGVLHDKWGFLYFLQALRNEGVLKLMAEPRLVTMSGRQASFLSGGEQAIPVPAGLGQIGVQFEEFGTRLNFVPIVLGNGRIHLEVEPEVSNLDPASGTTIAGTVVPGRITQRVRTTVELEAGQTFVVGGLIQHQVTANTQKVPVLGDLPFLGTAFSTKSYNETESELLVLVTPHLVDGMDCAQYPKVLVGQETRSPDDFELFLEGILEAPRGPRDVCHGKVYVPAYKNGPTAGQFPCAGGDHAGDHGAGLFHNHGGCPNCAADGSKPVPIPIGKPETTATRPMPPAMPNVSVQIEPLPPPGEPAPMATPAPMGMPAPVPTVLPTSLPAEEVPPMPEMK